MILICGATGILGGMIAHRLLNEGKEVRILVRHDSPAEQLAKQGLATSPAGLIKAGAIPIHGDLKDRSSLEKACQGIETVITTVNTAMRAGEDTVDTVDRRGNRNLIEAAREKEVQQFVFISFMGADLNHPVPLFKAKAETEKILCENGMPYTILAPNFYMESWVGMVVGIPLQARMPVTLVGEGKRLHSFISIVDVAAFATAVIGHPEALNRKIVLGGPEALSWRGIVEAIGHAIGAEIPVTFVVPGDPIPGLPEIVPPVLAGMEMYDSVIPMHETASTFGVNQLSLPTVIQQMFKGSSS